LQVPLDEEPLKFGEEEALSWLQMVSRFTPELEDFDVEELVAALHAGAGGKLVEVEDEENGERVEVYLN